MTLRSPAHEAISAKAILTTLRFLSALVTPANCRTFSPSDINARQL
jgi:hypothetical protein